jgi:hypothetical protein
VKAKGTPGADKSQEEKDETVVVNVQQKTEVKKMNPNDEMEIHEAISELVKDAKDKAKALTNKDLPLDEYLLYFSLMKI